MASVAYKPIASLPAESVTDGEWSRSAWHERIWVLLDVWGTGRMGATAAESGIKTTYATSKVATVCGGIIVPLMQVIGGLVVLGSAAVHTIPKAIAEYSGASEDYERAKITQNAAQIALGKEGLTSAKLGVANQILYAGMGAGLTASGATTLASPAGTAVFGGTPIASTTAAGAAAAALGAVYVVRGMLMIGRAEYNLRYLNEFQTNFRSSLAQPPETLQGLEAHVKTAIENVDRIGYPSQVEKRRQMELLRAGATLEERIAHLKQIDLPALEQALAKKIEANSLMAAPVEVDLKIQQFRFLGQELLEEAVAEAEKCNVQNHALKRRIGEKVPELKAHATLDEKIAYLSAIDKGVHEKKLQQKISRIIGWAMFLGGVAAILASVVFTGGLSLALIGLFSAIFFIGMEGIFATYDSSTVFEFMRSRLYKPSEELSQLMAMHERLKRIQQEALARQQQQSPSLLDRANSALRGILAKVS